LGEGYGVKPMSVKSQTKIANSTVLRALLDLRMLMDYDARETPGASYYWEKSLLLKMTKPQLAKWTKWRSEMKQKEFPPLTKEKAALDFWWKHGIHPLLESGLVELPEKYRYLAENMSNKKGVNKEWKDWEKYKPDLRAKNLFETACRKALKNLASPITNKIKNRS
jgi:hypothetical protein